MIRFTITITWQEIAAWLIVGAALFVPLNALAWRSIMKPRAPFWRDLWTMIRRRPLLVPVQIVLWPVALAEIVR